MKHLLILLSLLSPLPAVAQDCPVERQEASLLEQAKAMNLSVVVMDDGTLKAFNANLAAMAGADPSAVPDMDKVDVVIVQPEGTVGDDEKTAGLFAFKDGCFIGGTRLPYRLFKAILERGQASE